MAKAIHIKSNRSLRSKSQLEFHVFDWQIRGFQIFFLLSELKNLYSILIHNK